MNAASPWQDADWGGFPPLIGEARAWLELAGLVADAGLRLPTRQAAAAPVMLVPGFMAGDASLWILGSWLRLRGHAVTSSGIRINVDCSERAVSRLQEHLREFVATQGSAAIVIGQSRGGTLARVLAVREADLVAGLIMLGAPVLEPLAVSAPVLRLVRSVARLAALGVPGTFSQTCLDGPCCVDFRHDLAARLPAEVRAAAIYSRSDGIVDWRACLDPDAEQIEVDSSHCGMGVNVEVYRELERLLSGAPA